MNIETARANAPGMGHDGQPLRVCTTCDVRHYDNCPDCFGFGVLRPGAAGVPMSAHRAVEGGKSYPCPTCGSDQRGVPAP